MNIFAFITDSKKMSKVTTIIIFLALIRCLVEPFRLVHYASTSVSFTVIKPFLLGALISSIALLFMTILSYFKKYKIINGTCILTIILLFIVKWIYKIKIIVHQTKYLAILTGNQEKLFFYLYRTKGMKYSEEAER